MSSKVALITGVNGGLGSIIVENFLKQGFQVVGTDVQANPLAKFNALEKFRYVSCNLRDKAQIAHLFSLLKEREGKLDVTVSVAGILGPQAPIVDYADADWEAVIDINLTASFRVLQQSLRMMLPAKKGKIILIGSIAGSIGVTTQGAYVASKHGLNGLIKTAALENAKTGVQINGVAPGFLDSGMSMATAENMPALLDYMRKQNPTGQLVSAQEVANLTLWLAQESGFAVTGQVFAIDQGYTLR